MFTAFLSHGDFAIGPSKESIEQSNRFASSNRIDENEKLLVGYKDAGKGITFDDFGAPQRIKREILVFKDRQNDPILRRVIDDAKRKMNKFSTVQEKSVFLKQYVKGLLIGDALENQKKRDAHEARLKLLIGKSSVFIMEMSLGRFIDARAGVCRHNALLFKIIADEVGLKAALVRGKISTSKASGPHAWNEVVLENGRRLVVDCVYDIMGGSNDPQVKSLYSDANGNPMYRDGFLDAGIKGVARQQWTRALSPREGKVERVDVSAMNEAQRTALLNELRQNDILRNPNYSFISVHISHGNKLLAYTKRFVSLI